MILHINILFGIIRERNLQYVIPLPTAFLVCGLAQSTVMRQ